MAATVSSVWAKPGAWALDSEEHEEELKREAEQPKPFRAAAAADPPAAEFPSLAVAAAAKPKKKNKGQSLSLAEFTTYGSTPKPSEPKRLTQDELIMLPTGPRERTAEELDRTRLGGGFRNYGADRDSSRVRVSDRNREGSNRERDMGPSRADEVDDWSKTKKFGSSFGSDGRSERRDRDRGGFFNSSRADEVDNWGSNKSFAPPSDPPRRERRMGFESYSNGSGPDADNWLKKKEERPAVDSDTWGRKKDDRDLDSENWGRKKDDRDLDSENWGRKKEEIGGNTNGNGVAAARPRLNLQPRTLPISSVQSPGEGGKSKGSNPFGSARPREEVLAEKGQDWKEIDEKLEAVKIKEKEVVNDKGEGFGRRKGFGMGRVDSGDDKTVKSWRKPESKDDVPPPPPSSCAETTENSAETTEDNDATENVPEEN